MAQFPTGPGQFPDNWKCITEDPNNASDPLANGETAVRDSEKWCLFTSNSSEAEKAQQLGETKVPQELRVLPGDMDALPEDIQNGECDWSILPNPD